MAEYVRKSIVGFKEVEGGLHNAECTHVVMTRREYEEIINEMQKVKREAEQAKHNADARVMREIEDAENEIRRVKKKADQEINKIKKELEEERAENESCQRLNENLLRISKERANADRNLRPKKEHTGYVVISSSEKPYRYKNNAGYWETVTLWETVLQSHYSVDFTEEQARNEMKELTGGNGKSEWIISRLGISASYDGEYEDMINDEAGIEMLRDGRNIMLKRKLRANYNAGYWEISFIHTDPLGIVPREMRAR